MRGANIARTTGDATCCDSFSCTWYTQYQALAHALHFTLHAANACVLEAAKLIYSYVPTTAPNRAVLQHRSALQATWQINGVADEFLRFQRQGDHEQEEKAPPKTKEDKKEEEDNEDNEDSEDSEDADDGDSEWEEEKTSKAEAEPVESAAERRRRVALSRGHMVHDGFSLG